MAPSTQPSIRGTENLLCPTETLPSAKFRSPFPRQNSETISEEDIFWLEAEAQEHTANMRYVNRLLATIGPNVAENDFKTNLMSDLRIANLLNNDDITLEDLASLN